MSFELIRGTDAIAAVQDTEDHTPVLLKRWVAKAEFSYGEPMKPDTLVRVLVAANDQEEVAKAMLEVLFTRTEREDSKFVRIPNFAMTNVTERRGIFVFMNGVTPVNISGEPAYRTDLSYSGHPQFIAGRMSTFLMIAELITYRPGFIIPTSLLGRQLFGG